MSNVNNIMSSTNNVIGKAINNIINDLLKEIEKQMPAKVQAVQQEILQSYIAITQTEVVEYFYKWYGPNFDVNSLQSSITCYLNGIAPNFHYDKSRILFKQSLRKSTRKFNENEEDYNNFLDFDNSEQEDKYDSDDIGEEYDELSSNYSSEDDDFEPYNKKFIEAAFPDLDKVYMGAKVVIYEKFLQQFEKVIRPRILSKYGIKIK